MGKITFGYGLGDIFYLPILYVITFVYIITFSINRKKDKQLLITNTVFTIPIIWIVLSVTLWRGPEYSWNGELFYPSKKSKESYATKRKRWQSEIDSLKTDVTDDPQNTEALVEIGELKSLLGKDKEALEYLEKALRKGNTSKYTRSKLARKYEDNDLIDKAVEQYEEILKVDSLNRSAKFNLRRLKKKYDNS
ncbi:hypothetical protein HGP29_28395 [Flammeovirga sp. SR4]|uniref:Tetratricopeptide repeat protein n=2 Tax=Flammeovirga agarivorans TaxID=2726742 RepID=A0A7X8XZK4_9BACT|nr:hypothetical protein [Flammeovirga agarivorans]